MSTTPKPGDTLTAKQANALPMGSVLAHFETKGRTVERMNDGWAWSDEPSHRASEIVCDGHTLVRVGPAPANCPHPEGSLEWARWMAQEQGKCVQDGTALRWLWKWQHHKWLVWQRELASPEWVDPYGAPENWTINTCLSGWSIASDPAASAETPIVHEELREKVETLIAERDRLRTENADLLATAEVLKAERDNSRLESMNYERECMKALEQRDAREAMLDRFVEALGGTEACGEHSSSNCPWHVALEEAEALRTERDAALARAEKAEARVVVPEDVRADVDRIISLKDSGYTRESVRCARFILSLAADHLPDAGQMVPFASTHPEGSREWADDAMRQGFSVAYKDQNDGSFWKDFKCVSRDADNGLKWEPVCETGWRIHEPSQPATLESRIAALEKAAGIEVEA